MKVSEWWKNSQVNYSFNHFTLSIVQKGYTSIVMWHLLYNACVFLASWFAYSCCSVLITLTRSVCCCPDLISVNGSLESWSPSLSLLYACASAFGVMRNVCLCLSDLGSHCRLFCGGPLASYSPLFTQRHTCGGLGVACKFALLSCVVYGPSAPFSNLYCSSVTSPLFNVEQRCTNGSLIYANVALNAAPLSVFVYLKWF